MADKETYDYTKPGRGAGDNDITDQVLRSERQPESFSYNPTQNKKMPDDKGATWWEASKDPLAKTGVRQQLAKVFRKNKGLMGGGVIVAIFSLALFFASVFIQGPSQLIQAGLLLNNTYNTGKEILMGGRLIRNVSLILKHGRNNADDAFARQRLGVLSNKVVDRMNNRLLNKGISANTLAGGNSGFTINPQEYFGNERWTMPAEGSSGDARARSRMAADMGVNPDHINRMDGGYHFNLDQMSTAEKKALAKSLNTFTGNRFRPIGAIQERLFLRRIGAVFGLHIFDRASTAMLKSATNKLAALVENRMSSSARTASIDAWRQSEINNGVDADEVDRLIAERAESAIAREAVQNTITKAASKAVLVTMILDIACMINNVLDESNGWRTMLFNRAVDGATQTRGAADQIRAAQITPELTASELSYDAISAQTQLTMAREIPIVSIEDPNDTDIATQDIDMGNFVTTLPDDGNMFTYDSWWASAYVSQAANGQASSAEMKGRTTPVGLLQHGAAEMLRSVPVLGAVLSFALDNFMADGACFLYNTVMGAVFAPLGWILEPLLANNEFLLGIAKWYKDFMYGGEFEVDDLYPSMRGTTDMVGGFYSAQTTKMTMGAEPVTTEQAISINKEAKAYLAEEYKNKSLFDKTFDTGDYRSAIATLSREAGWNNSDGSVVTHLANVAKTVASLPKLFASSISGISGVYAADGFDAVVDLSIDMEIQNMDWSEDMRELLVPEDFNPDANETPYDIAPNTEYVMNQLQDENGNEHPNFESTKELVRKTWQMNIDHNGNLAVIDDGSLGEIDEQPDGDFSLDLADNSGSVASCTDNGGDAELCKHLSVYLFDWALMGPAGGACLEAGDCDRELGYGEASSSGLAGGGMTLEQAQNFMAVYNQGPGSSNGKIYPVGGCKTSVDNCVAFSAYFVRNFTTLYHDGGRYGDGGAVAWNLADIGWELSDEPRVYSVFSFGARVYTGGWSHTGVVLGINKEANTIIFGEANYCLSDGRAIEMPYDQFMAFMLNGGGTYTFAYLPDQNDYLMD